MPVEKAGGAGPGGTARPRGALHGPAFALNRPTRWNDEQGGTDTCNSFAHLTPALLLLPSMDGPFPLAGYRMQFGSKPRMRAAAGPTKCGLHRVFTPLGQFISRPLQSAEGGVPGAARPGVPQDIGRGPN